ncbi:host-nuclease inhibitor Gam family protein [Algimonas porphyrae]|uniref:Host-nuclease inhibitor protein Gam n=1 Tax=Algimonas porphyrae TaxID=1128113 RepID=A0ABQ5UZ46_9PROT|nr:host-nuclease inhibitor Gam family protein [Algimonas porphyrae]GLQ20476.1 host-nuclease inhibitor protein Gam [Algimonas porphyrae]
MSKRDNKISGGAPQSRAEAEEWMSRLQKVNIRIRDIDTDLREQSADLKVRAAAKVEPFINEKEIISKGLFAWAEANRDALTNGGKTKTIKLETGTVFWRQQPAKVTLRGVDKVLEYLSSNRLRRFIRIKKEVDKDAMLREQTVASKIPGVSIKSAGEMIEAKPFEDTLEASS